MLLERPRHPDSEDQAEARPAGRSGARVDLTDPKAMRALAHPLRWALLEALGEAGTLTATQASEMLGESRRTAPFTCGPWRSTASWRRRAAAGAGNVRGAGPTTAELARPARGSTSSAAGQALNQVWIDRLLTRARRSLTSTASWPQGFGDALGGSASRLYVTPAEARQLYAE